jgi:hypothetical protein
MLLFEYICTSIRCSTVCGGYQIHKEVKHGTQAEEMPSEDMPLRLRCMIGSAVVRCTDGGRGRCR